MRRGGAANAVVTPESSVMLSGKSSAGTWACAAVAPKSATTVTSVLSSLTTVGTSSGHRDGGGRATGGHSGLGGTRLTVAGQRRSCTGLPPTRRGIEVLKSTAV